MTCENCDPRLDTPGSCILVVKHHEGWECAYCGDFISHNRTYFAQEVERVNLWDSYFHSICVAVASKSPCLSRKIGALLVKDHSVVSTGYNGPPRGVPHCGHERMIKDNTLSNYLIPSANRVRFSKECPRRVLGYESGTHMELCPAQHAEENAISNAARLGTSVLGATLYMNSVIPCQKCYGTLINAGIVEIVVDKETIYDQHTQFLIDNSNIKIRSFNL